MRKRDSYDRVDHWRGYLRFLPERLRLGPGRAPVEEWWAWHEADVHLDRFSASDAPLVVLLLHGGGGYGRLLAPFGAMLHAHGYEVALPDLPGYGLTLAPSRLCHYDRWADCVADLAADESRRSGRPVVLFGMSIGGYLAYLAAARWGRAAGVIATALIDLAHYAAR